MKSNKLKRSLSFLMSVLLVLGTVGSDFATVTSYAEGTSTDDKSEPKYELTYDLSSETEVEGTKIKKTAEVNGNQITFTFAIDGNTENISNTTTQYTSTDVVFVMDLSNSMIEEQLDCDKWFFHIHGSSCYKTVDRLAPAKAAVKSFANELLAGDLSKHVRVGIASFGTAGHNECALTNQIGTINTAVNAINLEKEKYGNNSSYTKRNSSSKVANGGTNIQAGLQQAETMLSGSKATNKIIVIMSDGVPTFAFETQGNKTYITGEGDEISTDVVNKTTAEATKAKNSKIQIYSIAYDLTEQNASTMKAIASPNVAATNDTPAKNYFYHAESSSNNVPGAIGNITYGIAKEIKNSIPVAAAQDIVITDTLPSYIKFNEVKAQNGVTVTLDADKSGFSMNVGSPKSDDHFSATVTATIDMEAMITSFVGESEGKFADKEAVLAQMASENGLAVPLNGQVVIEYKDKNGTPQPNNEEIKIGSAVAAAVVPYEYFHAYPYSLTVNIDGKKSDLSQSGNAYAGKVISVDLDSYKNVNEYTITTDLATDYEFTVSATGKNDYVVNINHKKYNVTFKNGENIISSVDYFWNDTVVIPENPTKDKDAQYSYNFKSWNPTVATTVNGSAVYNAEYELNVNSYKVYFNNYDGTTLNGEGEGEAYIYGSTPEYKGATPTKPETDAKTFTFAGWDKEITAVTGDVTYTAVFTDVDKLFTVTFVNYDGTVLETLTGLKWGDAVAYSGNTPLKPADNENTYKFADTWSPALVSECNGNATYEAQFSSEKITYTVKFVADGKVVSEQNLSWGDAVDVPADPTKAADNYNTYEFKNWTPSVSETCKGDVTYTAVFDQTAIEYTITFLNEDDSVYDSYKVGYGEALTTPVAPTKESTDTTKYTFAGWTPVVPATCEGNATFKATFDESARYTVIFMNGKEEVAKFVVDDGEKIEAPDFANLTKEADETYTYTCTGWDKEVETEVHASATYNAKFAETYIEYTVRFLNEDDSVISSAEYHYGDTVEEATATKANTQEYTYKFAGWTPEFVAKCEGSVDYKAQFNAKRNQYTVNFVDYDGTVIETITEDYGTPFNAPADPDRDADKTYTYKFAGWDKTVADTVTENVTYTATYDRTYIDYTVKFVDENGKEVATFVKHYNETIEVPEVPAKAADDQYSYVPNGWTPSVNTAVTEDATYEPVYRNVLNKYTITFYIDQKVYAQKEYEYGSKVEIPEDPTKDADATYTYKFAGWTPEVVDVVNTAEYYAVFTREFIDYKVNFYGANDTLIVTKTAHYNGTVAAPTATAPTGMHFTGWDKTFNPVTEDIDVYAQFDYNTYRANFYVVKPDATIKAEPAGERDTAVGQDSANYIDTKANADFHWTFAPKMSFAEGSNDKAAVEGMFDKLPTVSEITYITKAGNTLKLSNFDWYVLKNTKNSTSEYDWHVDGRAKTITLVVPEVKDLYVEVPYTGESLNATISEIVNSKIAELSTTGKTYSVDSITYPEEDIVGVLDGTGRYSANAHVTYSAEGYQSTIDVPVWIRVIPADVVVYVTVKDQTKTYNGSALTSDAAEYEITNVVKSVKYSTDTIVYTAPSVVSGTEVGSYALNVTKDNFSDTDKNVTVQFVVTDGNLVINPAVVKVNVTGTNQELTYNGSQQTADVTYVVEADNELYTEADMAFNGAKTVSGTNVADYAYGLKASDFANTNKNFTVTFEVEDGKLTINKAEATVTINGTNQGLTYTGTEQTAEVKYSVSVDNQIYTEQDFTFNGKAVVIGTEAGEYFYGLNASDFTNNNENVDVTFVVNDGKLVISRAAVVVTITAEDQELTYNGTTQTADVKFSAAADKAFYNVADVILDTNKTVSGENVGEYAYGLSSQNFVNNNKNVDVEFVVNDAKLTIVPAKVNVKVVGKDQTVTYNGDVQTVDVNYDVVIDNRLYSKDNIAFAGNTSVSGTDADNYAYGLDVNDFANTNDNFEVSFTVEDGKLVIAPATVNVKVTGTNQEKTYNASEQSVGVTYVVAADNELYTEDYISYVGAESVSGTNVDEYAYGLKATDFTNTNDNFAVTFEVEDGKLTINKATVIVSNTVENTELDYTGSVQTVELDDVVEISYSADWATEYVAVTLGSVSGRNVDSYAYGIDPDMFENLNPDNMDLVYELSDGLLYINPIEVVVSYEGLSKVYGNEDPELVVEFDGVVEGDVLHYDVYREEGENVGFYDVFINLYRMPQLVPMVMASFDNVKVEDEVEYANGNYFFTLPKFDNEQSGDKIGVFEITKRPVRVVANNASKVAGEADPTLSADVENLLVADSNLGQSVYVWRMAGESAGNYDMFAGINGIENWSNYSVTFVDGVFTITAAAVIPTPPVAPPTNPVPPTTPTVVPPTPTVVPPTPVVEEVPEVVPEVEIPEEETPMTEAPVVEEVPEVTPVVVPEVEIAEEETPLAAGHCFIHWIILLDTLIYAAYVALRATQNARELKDEKNAVEE